MKMTANISEEFIFETAGGRIAYEDSGGEGPVVICVPALGDTRAEYRFLAPKLQQEGFRVIAIDLRGHGGSSAGWQSYGADAVGDDVAALVDFLGQNVRVIGTSAGAGAAVWAAAERPARVRSIVLVGPFVRHIPTTLGQTVGLKLGFAGPWAAAAWGAFYRTLYPARRPADLDDYVDALKANLREPGRMEAVKGMIFTSKEPVEKRIDEVESNVLVVMGTKDPDFKDPKAEAKFVAERLGGSVVLIEGAGHHPHAEMPDETADAILKYLHETN